MRKRNIGAILLLFFAGSVAAAQSVTISPKRTVYRRPKPIQDFKKSFVVRRPIAKARTAVLSRKITAVISPETVLGLNIREEIGEYQWLEEADYEVLYNKNGILSIKLWMEGTAAYPDGVTKYATVDIGSGNRVRPTDLFRDLVGLAAVIKKRQGAEVKAALIEIKNDPANSDVESVNLFENVDFTSKDIKELSIDDSGVTFYYDYGFPHVIQALQPAGEFKFSWHEIRRYIKPGGLLGQFIR